MLNLSTFFLLQILKSVSNLFILYKFRSRILEYFKSTFFPVKIQTKMNLLILTLFSSTLAEHKENLGVEKQCTVLDKRITKFDIFFQFFPTVALNQQTVLLKILTSFLFLKPCLHIGFFENIPKKIPIYLCILPQTGGGGGGGGGISIKLQPDTQTMSTE